MTDIDSLLERIDRLESLEQIRQLPAKYTLALDMRDFDAMANLFVDDIGVPGKQRGRQAMKRWYSDTMCSNAGSFHGVHSHIIDFETAELAIEFDPHGKIQRIVPAPRNDAHKLIEECMLAANVCAAEVSRLRPPPSRRACRRATARPTSRCRRLQRPPGTQVSRRRHRSIHGRRPCSMRGLPRAARRPRPPRWLAPSAP